MIPNLLLGAGFKVGTNIVNTWMANKADEHRANMLQDAEVVKAHIELAKVANKDVYSKVSRSIIFLMLTSTFCFTNVYILMNYADFSEGLVPRKAGVFGRLFGHTEYTVVKSGWNILFFNFNSIMEMVVGFFVVPSRKR